MVTQIKVVLDDVQRRQLRLALGFRGGLASRKEVAAWANGLIAQGLKAAPEAPIKVKREPSQMPEKLRKAALAPDDAVCKNCGRIKFPGHGRMGFICMVPPGQKVTVFEASE